MRIRECCGWASLAWGPLRRLISECCSPFPGFDWSSARTQVGRQQNCRQTCPFSSLHEALAEHPVPDMLVIATPTPTHLELLSQALGTTAGLVLAEKPLSDSTGALDDLENAHGVEELAQRVRVAHHFAFFLRLSRSIASSALMTIGVIPFGS